MDFSKRRALFKRPGAGELEDDTVKVVKAKPIAEKYSKKLGPDHRAKNFVTASESSAAEFYSNNQVIEIEEQKERERREANRLTPDQKNKLSAKIVKAEMMGNKELVRKLKDQLESGYLELEDPKDQPRATTSQGGKNSEEVILTRTDPRTGITVPYRKQRTVDLRAETSDQEASVRSLREMVEDEKMLTADDNLAMIGDMAYKSAASQRLDDDWTVDDALLAKKKKRKDVEREERRKRTKAIADHRRFEETLDSCVHCIESKKLRRHLIVATGLKTYLAVPHRQSLVEGHCLIVPMSHVSSAVQLDEDVFDEMKIWRKGLVAMFRDREEDCVFMEMAKNVDHQPHMCVECLPLPIEVGDTAPIYFKKAIQESETEWSQNKKLVDLSRHSDIRRAIPKGFSYFAVDFGLQNGFAHVIEDEKMFPACFGKEILGGMLDLDHNRWRNPPVESFEEQTSKVKALKEMWAPYDWTERAKAALTQSEDSD